MRFFNGAVSQSLMAPRCCYPRKMQRNQGDPYLADQTQLKPSSAFEPPCSDSPGCGPVRTDRFW
jgi:hypothetical protein